LNIGEKVKKLLITATFILGFIVNSYACEVIAPKQTSIAISSNSQEQIYYNALRILDSAPFTTIDRCKLTAAKRRFVMLALGVENLILHNRNSTYSISDRDRDHQCRIENSDLKSQFTHKEQFAELKLKREFLNKCVVVKVTDFGPKGLHYPEDQVGCKIQRISDNAANFTGGYCYFKPDFNSNISVELETNPDCLSVEGLKAKKITAKDFNAVLNVYTSDASNGENNDLVAIGGGDVRFSVNPVAEVVKPADDFGVTRPVFPANYTFNEIHLGKPEVASRRKYVQFKFPFVVDTRCERKCSGGLCSSPCDYAQPVVGEHILEVFEDGKWEYVNSWYDGAVAPGQWQGILYGMGKRIQKNALLDNAKYRVKITFREPNLDFKYFDGDVTRSLYLNNNNIGGLSSRGRIGLIPLIHNIPGGDDIPLITPIAELDFNGSLDGVERSLRTFQSYLNNKFWPPLYEDVCNASGTCIENGKKFLELGINFVLTKEGNNYQMKDVHFSRGCFRVRGDLVEVFPASEDAKVLL
jgi:hypothetical protein